MALKRRAKDENFFIIIFIYLFFVFFCFYCSKLIINQGSLQNLEFFGKQFLRVRTKVSALTIVYALWTIIFICDNVVENVLS